VSLGHAHGVGIRQKPTVANIAITVNGTFLVAADIYNDAISVLDLTGRMKVGELDLRPGVNNPNQTGVAGGESPFGIAIKGNDTAEQFGTCETRCDCAAFSRITRDSDITTFYLFRIRPGCTDLNSRHRRVKCCQQAKSLIEDMFRANARQVAGTT
jgi:hypothetical protein